MRSTVLSLHAGHEEQELRFYLAKADQNPDSLMEWLRSLGINPFDVTWCGYETDTKIFRAKTVITDEKNWVRSAGKETSEALCLVERREGVEIPDALLSAWLLVAEHSPEQA